MMIRLVCSIVLVLSILDQCVHAQKVKIKKGVENDSQKDQKTALKRGDDNSCNCAGVRCGISNREGRVVGGKPTGQTEYPWAAALSYRGKLYCGATLVTNEHLVTAAHCISGITKSRVEIVMGSYNKSDTSEPSRREHKVKEWWAHPDFNRRTFNNDIGIIRLDKKVDFDHFVRPVCISEANPRSTFIGEKGIVIGWGRQDENGVPSDVLREVRVPIMSNDECKTKNYKPKEITDNMMCAGFDAGKIDACQGDSGGPLLLEKQTSGGTPQIDLIGVVSWGQGCARARYPGVYTRISRYTEFINSKLSNGCKCPRS
ncbi:unnamed protein product [Meganyctiphanes norvegica]|uniref:Peptidase S1 domain-containing protein n=1 Tax=Meganyctiphanes norvegica TaxID=48144 RepID=A0AAV2RBI0_MEGNR